MCKYMYDKYNKKIMDYKDENVFIIFYSPWCKFCDGAIELLKKENMSFKGYNIDNMKGGMDKLLHYLKKQKSLTNFNEEHKTRPIIFYKGKFIGGLDDLKSYLNTL